MKGRPRIPEEDRFWRLVEVTARKDRCWNWKASLTSNGYGSFGLSKKRPRHGANTEQAHRTAWRLTSGPIPKGLLVCHHCDNKLCVNPDHLFLGTSKENTQDMIRKGRKVRNYTYVPFVPNSGIFRKGHLPFSHEIRPIGSIQMTLIESEQAKMKDLQERKYVLVRIPKSSIDGIGNMDFEDDIDQVNKLLLKVERRLTILPPSILGAE